MQPRNDDKKTAPAARKPEPPPRFRIVKLEPRIAPQGVIIARPNGLVLLV